MIGSRFQLACMFVKSLAKLHHIVWPGSLQEPETDNKALNNSLQSQENVKFPASQAPPLVRPLITPASQEDEQNPAPGLN